MFEKRFRIVSNNGEYLTAAVIAQALLNYFTYASGRPDVTFGVIEEKKYPQDLPDSEIKIATA